MTREALTILADWLHAEGMTALDEDRPGITGHALRTERANKFFNAEMVLRGGAWEPIETAPKDKRIRLWVPIGVGIGEEQLGKWDPDQCSNKPRPFWCWDHSGITWQRANQPTHWQPTSAPPAGEGGT